MLALLTLLAAAPTPAETAFTQLKAIAGDWEANVSKDGGADRILRVSYRVIAADSALVETWTTPSGGTTMTVFHLDGSRMIATHCCAQGNQPRLLWRRTAGPLLTFDSADGTNLGASASRLHRLELGLVDGKLQRREVYRTNGKDVPPSDVLFTRR